MLKSIRLKNFKLHEDTSIEAAPITVFIGPNNSGKSSIFQALLALRQAASRGSDVLVEPANRQPTSPEQPYLFPGDGIIDLGEFKDVLRRGETEIQLEVTGSSCPPKHLDFEEPINVAFEVHCRDNRLGYHKGRLQLPQGAIHWEWIGSYPTQGAESSVRIQGLQLRFTAVNNFRLLSPFESLLDKAGRDVLPAARVAHVREMESRLSGVPRALLDSLHAILPIRGFEEWGYPLPQERAHHLERLTLPDRAVSLVTTIASDSRLKKEVSDRLSDLLNIRVDIEYVGANRVKIFAIGEKGGDGQRLFVNEGTGANQLPFILVPVAVAAKNETILLSEPEAHLHPKGQCELTRMLLTVAKKENIQFFIETHSEHVLHVILNAIGKLEWEPNQVAIYSFENVNGTAQVTRLEVDEQGGVKGGIPGFFDQSLDELTEYLETLKKPTV
jgi:energy-coupling factor transporter ATP-binding protein EcfA2